MPVWDAWSCLGTSNQAHRALYSETPPAEPCPCCRSAVHTLRPEQHCSVLQLRLMILNPSPTLYFALRVKRFRWSLTRRCFAIWRFRRCGGTESCLPFTRLRGDADQNSSPPPLRLFLRAMFLGGGALAR